MATKHPGPTPVLFTKLLHGLTATMLAVVLAGCNGDTLYEEVVDGDGPAMLIERPATGSEVARGRRIPVRIVALDSIGVTQVDLVWTGIETGRIEIPVVPPRIAVTIDTAFTLSSSSTGALELRAIGRNGDGRLGRSDAVSLAVTAGDTIAPALAVTANVPARVELTDSLRVRVTASDNEGGIGLTTIGITALVRISGEPTPRVFEQAITLVPPVTGVIVQDFAFPAPFVDARSIPRTMTFEFHAFAVDSASNCAAAVASTTQRLTCTEYTSESGTHTISGGEPAGLTTTVTAGHSYTLPAGSAIADAVPDVARQRLYLSNKGRNRIEVFDLNARNFRAPVTVGSEPWGIAMNRSNDTLIVANSGGTNVSYVPLGAGTLAEAVARRIHTPNAVLFQVMIQKDAAGNERLAASFVDFSDRPQYIAQDAEGRILFSTVPTDAARDGTMRVGENLGGWQQAEVRLLINGDVFEPDSSTISILNVDSLRIFVTPTQGDLIEIYDHRRGFPGTLIRSGIVPLAVALGVLASNPDSDIEWTGGRYDLDLAGLGDTTYVAASADRQRVAFGEGARGNGRIILWRSATASISNEITIADLVSNSAERILAIALNSDGSLGAARGTSAAYFFKNDDLRLEGLFAAPVSSGRSGAGLHPQHPSYSSYPPSGASTLAFVADETRIRIVDTVHFTERGTIEVRDRLIGPMRVSAPLAGDNTGCSGEDCLVARVYAVTSAGAVVLVEVRGRDIH